MKKILKVFTILITVLLLVGCNKTNEKIVIYSSMEEARNQALKSQLKDKFPNYNVIVQHMPTGNTAAKIKNEGANIEADIILSLETAHMKNLQDNFANLNNLDIDNVYLNDIKNEQKYLLWNKYTMSIIIDNKYFKQHNLNIPKSYDDLLKPEYKGLIAMPDVKTSGTGYAFFLNAVNIMGKENAIKYFNKLKSNLREFTTSGSAPTNLLKQGEIAIALGLTIEGANAINEGYDFKIIELESGAPYNFTSTGIIKGKDKDSVKEVFKWLMTDFIYYDKENFSPEIILKNQNNKIKNYPVTKKYADMKNIDNVKTKEDLINIWSEVNG